MSDFDIGWIEKYTEKPPTIFFDIGSFDGEDSFRASSKYPDCFFHIFEASEENFKSILKSPKIIPKKHFINNKGVFSKKGKNRFNLSTSQYPGSGSLFEFTDSLKERLEIKSDKFVEIECITVSDYCIENGIKHIDVVHMDVQGAEFEVIKGMGEFLPKLLFIEVSEFQNYKTNTSLDDIESFLYENDYSLSEKLTWDRLYVRK